MLASGVNAFLAPDNVLGWTLADVAALVVIVVATVVFRQRLLTVPRAVYAFAANTRACLALLFVLPVALRLFLLLHSGVPVPSGADDFGYLLVADTLRHARLANPPNRFPDAFAQIFVLQSPAYAAIFPLGQGAALALGWTVFGHPWAGVLLTAGGFCALTYWMLRAWTTPIWSLVGGLFAVAQFGPLCYWMNCYWGGYVSASAGCLAFGAIGRLRREVRGEAAVLLGCGVALQALTRQYETLLLLAALATTRVFRLRLSSVLPLLAAGALILAQNRAITGHWTQLPYSMYRYEHGVPATFTFQPNPVPHAALNAEQDLDYRTESAVHDMQSPESFSRYFARLFERIRFLRFFWSAPLLAAVIFGFVRKGVREGSWPLIALLLFIAGSNFYPYFYPHYIAAATCLFLLTAIYGLQRLPRAAAVAVLFTAGLQFATWYSLHLFGKSSVYEAWDFINASDPQGRLAVAQVLDRTAGKQIVFVHYSPEHHFAEWIHNEADVASGQVIFAHDLGRDRNADLLKAYPGRQPWLLMPDESPPLLERYVTSTPPFEDVP